jgi:hypothetical protein
LVGTAACDDAFGPRPRPTGVRPDTTGNGQTSGLIWYELQPRAVPLGTDSVRVTVGVEGSPTRVQLNTWAKFIALPRVSDGIYSARVAVNDLLFGYRSGDLRNTAAFVEVEAGSLTQQTSITVNVRDATIQLVDPQSLSSRVQAASHVVNIRFDSLYVGEQLPPEVLRTFYQFFNDDYDFVSVIEQVQSNNDYSYFAVRNAVAGLGLQLFDRAETYGSNARLQGILHFPNEGDFDPANTSVLHELGHRWFNFSNLPSLRNHRPHWPISTLAIGINGYSDVDPLTAQPNVFRFDLTPQPNGTYLVTTLADRPRRFNDFELYLMGLLPPDSVASHITFLNQDQRNRLTHNGVLTGPTDTITVAKWVARDGVRTPAYPQAQRTFRMATILVSRNGLLTREELSYYNALAIRAEAETALSIIQATTRSTTLPFFAATSGRGELVTRLRLTQTN